MSDFFDDSNYMEEPEMQRLIAEAQAAGGTPEEIDARLQQLTFDLAAVMGAELLKNLKVHTAEMLADRRSTREGFLSRLREKWGDAFDKLRALIEAVHEMGSEYNTQYRPAAAQERDFVFDALVRTHARACLLGNEILWQMEGGFASGAMARWRTLHELTVVAFFIKGHGQDVAERYLLHHVIESCKAAAQYHRYCERLGREPLGEDELRQNQEIKEELCRRFGREYEKDWGWAAAAMGSANPSFADIERSLDLDHMRPYFKLACYSNHAGSKGLQFDLGNALVPPGRQVLLAGSSDAGFFDPGFCTAVSLYQVTVCLLTHKSTFVSLEVLAAINLLVEEVEEAFAEAEARLESMAKKMRDEEVS